MAQKTQTKGPSFSPDWRFQEPVPWRDTDLDENILTEWFHYMLLGRQVDYRSRSSTVRAGRLSSSRAPATRPGRSAVAGHSSPSKTGLVPNTGTSSFACEWG